MKKLALISVIAVLVVFGNSCANKGEGQLVGVKDRPTSMDIAPFGMAYIPAGHF